MKSTGGRAIVTLCLLGTLAASIVIYSLFPAGAGGQAAQLQDTGKFRVGSALGHERAGFSGRPMVQVFTTADSLDWPLISACLESAEVEEEMAGFTGVLIDERLDLEVEADFRAQGLKVIVRGLNGSYLGGLSPGYLCPDLAALLRFVRFSTGISPEKSPIYARLLETAEPIDVMIQSGERAEAEKFVGFLEEFEGSDSPAVQAAKARMAQ